MEKRQDAEEKEVPLPNKKTNRMNTRDVEKGTSKTVLNFLGQHKDGKHQCRKADKIDGCRSVGD
jgi:hypothetical protein